MQILKYHATLSANTVMKWLCRWAALNSPARLKSFLGALQQVRGTLIPRFFNCRNDRGISHNFAPLAVLHRELGKAAVIHFKHWVCQRVGTCHQFWPHAMWKIDEFRFRNVNWAVWVQVWTLCITAFHRGSEFIWPLPVTPHLCSFFFSLHPCS